MKNESTHSNQPVYLKPSNAGCSGNLTGSVRRVAYLSTHLLNPTIAIFYVNTLWKVWSFSELHKNNLKWKSIFDH